MAIQDTSRNISEDLSELERLELRTRAEILEKIRDYEERLKLELAGLRVDLPDPLVSETHMPEEMDSYGRCFKRRKQLSFQKGRIMIREYALYQEDENDWGTPKFLRSLPITEASTDDLLDAAPLLDDLARKVVTVGIEKRSAYASHRERK